MITFQVSRKLFGYVNVDQRYVTFIYCNAQRLGSFILSMYFKGLIVYCIEGKIILTWIELCGLPNSTANDSSCPGWDSYLYICYYDYYYQQDIVYKRPENRVHSRNSAVHKIMNCYLGPIVFHFSSTCDCLGFYT